MWNKAKCVLLASNQEVNIILDKNKLEFIENAQIASTINSSVKGYHLYILSENDLPIPGEWNHSKGNDFISNHLLGISYLSKKVIASTDINLRNKYLNELRIYKESENSLPQIPQSFIEQHITEYNKSNIISDVLVEYNEERTNPDEPDSYALFKETLKINEDNTINIKTVKDSFSRDEVEGLLFSLAEHYGMTSAKSEIDDFNTWIEQNL